MSPRRNRAKLGNRKSQKHEKRSSKASKFRSFEDRDYPRDDSEQEARGGSLGGGGGRGITITDRSGRTHTIGGGGAASSRVGGSAGPRGHKSPSEIRNESRQSFEESTPERESRSSGFRGRDNRDDRGSHFKKDRFQRAPRGREESFDEESPRHSRSEKHKTRAQTGYQTLKATVDKNRKGFGFLIFEGKGYEDAFINPRDASRVFHGDRVEATVNTRGEVTHIKVIEHRFREIVGRYEPHVGGGHKGKEKGAWVVYERKRAREQVFVPKASVKANANDWVKAKLEFHESGPFGVTAEITDVYGPELPPSADIEMVAAEYNLTEEHSAAAEREAAHFRLDTRDRNRKDLTQVPFITIDGETARDFDDAVYIERTQDRGFILWVAIADVSHYVTLGSALDKEARSRGTSVYFPERAFHMLPRALSENLCSLRPNEPRLAMVSKLYCDSQGKRTKVEVMEALIESKRRATYTEIENEWQANQNNPNWEYAPHFELYKLMRKNRTNRGSIDFDLPEANVLVKPTGEPISITHRPRLDAHRLIEEFMIAANEAVTDWTMEQGWPFIFRIHEEPAEKSLFEFQKLAAHAGVNFAIRRENLSQSLADLVAHLEGHPAQHLLNMALLRSMKRAVYSSTHDIHFGLASQGYTHFTSPIRRYPDLVVHRILRMILKSRAAGEGSLKAHDREKLEQDLADIAEHCSYRERIASDAERESIKLKQVRIMLDRVGEEFPGKVVGMTDNGMFVQIPDPYVEGMVTKDSMSDDFYEFNEDRMTFSGRRKRKIFKIGTEVKVQLMRADIDLRLLDFAIVDTLVDGKPGVAQYEDDEDSAYPAKTKKERLKDRKKDRGHPGKNKKKERGAKNRTEGRRKTRNRR